MLFFGLGEVNCYHKWARKDEVNTLREYNSEELRGDGAGFHQKSGVPVMYGLRWEEIWELESHIGNAMRGSLVCVWVCVDLGVRVDRVASSE